MTTTFLQAVPPTYGDGGVMMWGMLIAMFAIMYFFMIRPQNKKRKAIENFRKTLAEARRRAAEGDPFSIKWLEENKELLDDEENN